MNIIRYHKYNDEKRMRNSTLSVGRVRMYNSYETLRRRQDQARSTSPDDFCLGNQALTIFKTARKKKEIERIRKQHVLLLQ